MTRSGSPHQFNLECRDAVHGFVYLSKAEWAIVDCPTFQRLRDIRQLAMAHLVYPGATHTRLEHSLGCVHLSDLIYQAVNRQVAQDKCPDFAWAFRTDTERWEHGRDVLRLASLLHDLGHSPFSHSGENLMPEIEVNGKRRPAKHEDLTARLIRDTEVAEKLEKTYGAGTIEEVIAVAVGLDAAKLPKGADPGWYGFLSDILTGEPGSDRMDYLLRDATHSGQSAGLFDFRKLIDSMTIVPPPQETMEPHRLGLDEAGWLVAEQMVAARYLMYVALYFHKTKRIYELHLEDFLRKWLEKEYHQPHFLIDPLSEYVQLTDSRVWAAIYEAANGTDVDLRSLARPFVDRTHLRLAHELILADNFTLPVPRAWEQFLSDIEKRQKNAQGQPLRPAEVIRAWHDSLGSVLRQRHPRAWDRVRFDKLVAALNNNVRDELGIRIRPDQTEHHAAKFFGTNRIWVYMNGQTRYLDELSEIVNGMPERIWRGRIYAPEAKRDDVKSFCDKWLDENPMG